MNTPKCRHSHPGVVRRCGCWTCGSSFMGEVREIVALSRPGMRHQHSRQNTLRHDGPQQHRKATTGRSIQKFRMQFPQHRIAPHIHIVGIATFVETVESSPNQIACETAPSKRNQRARGPYIVRLGDPAIGLTRSAPQDSSSLADRPLSHRRTSTARDGGYVADDEAGAPRG